MKMCLYGFPRFFRIFRSSSASSRSSAPSGREARVVVPTLQTVPDPPSASNPLPDPTPRFDIRAPRPMPPAPPPIPALRLEEIRQLVMGDMEDMVKIPIHYVQNNRFDGFVDIDEATFCSSDGRATNVDPESLRDSISRHSIASDRIISIENDRVDGVLEIDPESRNSIETQ